VGKEIVRVSYIALLLVTKIGGGIFLSCERHMLCEFIYEFGGEKKNEKWQWKICVR